MLGSKRRYLKTEGDDSEKLVYLNGKELKRSDARM